MAFTAVSSLYGWRISLRIPLALQCLLGTCRSSSQRCGDCGRALLRLASTTLSASLATCTRVAPLQRMLLLPCQRAGLTDFLSVSATFHAAQSPHRYTLVLRSEERRVGQEGRT